MKITKISGGKKNLLQLSTRDVKKVFRVVFPEGNITELLSMVNASFIQACRKIAQDSGIDLPGFATFNLQFIGEDVRRPIVKFIWRAKRRQLSHSMDDVVSIELSVDNASYTVLSLSISDNVSEQRGAEVVTRLMLSYEKSSTYIFDKVTTIQNVLDSIEFVKSYFVEPRCESRILVVCEIGK